MRLGIKLGQKETNDKKALLMKKINLVTTISPQKQYELQRWFYMIVVSSLVLLGMGAYFIIPPFLSYLTLKKDIQLMHNKMGNYSTNVNSKESLKKEYDEWHMREKKVTSYTQQLKNPYSHIAYIVSLCKDDIQLESVRFHKKEVEIVVQCKTSAQASFYVKQLNESPLFSQVKMISLQHNDSKKQLMCTIKAHAIFS